MSSNNGKLDSKSKQLIVGIFAILILLTFSAVMIIAAYSYSGSKNEESTTSSNLLEGTTAYQNPESNINESLNNYPDESQSIQSGVTNEVSQTQKQELISVEGLEEFTKTGDNMISDSHP